MAPMVLGYEDARGCFDVDEYAYFDPGWTLMGWIGANILETTDGLVDPTVGFF